MIMAVLFYQRFHIIPAAYSPSRLSSQLTCMIPFVGFLTWSIGMIHRTLNYIISRFAPHDDSFHLYVILKVVKNLFLFFFGYLCEQNSCFKDPAPTALHERSPQNKNHGRSGRGSYRVTVRITYREVIRTVLSGRPSARTVTVISPASRSDCTIACTNPK